MAKLRAEHYLLLQMIETAQMSEGAHGKSTYYVEQRSAKNLGDDWALTVEQPTPDVDLDEHWSALAARRCRTRLNALTKAGLLSSRKITSSAGSQLVVYDLTDSGIEALGSATLDRFPHKVSVEVLLRQPGVPLSELEGLAPQIEAAAQAAVDALLGMIGRMREREAA
jgi:hypothetical protein